MAKLWLVFGLVMFILIWNGHHQQVENQGLFSRCGGNNQVERVTWDGATATGVTCKDGRRLHP